MAESKEVSAQRSSIEKGHHAQKGEREETHDASQGWVSVSAAGPEQYGCAPEADSQWAALSLATSVNNSKR